MKITTVKRKTRMVKGWLCRDNNGLNSHMVFLQADVVKLPKNGYWIKHDGELRNWYSWKPEDWKDEYDFPLLRKGRKLLVDIEL